jgi:chemotaxis protein methyltransferase CheR
MTDVGKGIALSDSNFKTIAEFAAAEAGLAIPEAKKSLVQSRVARRMRALGLTTCNDYISMLGGNADETQQLISALTTNVSHFFREGHHFRILREQFLTPAPNKLRFWSAGCSGGQEPYSLAMEIFKSIPGAAESDILILASDIDQHVLEKAKAGRFTASEVEGVPEDDRKKFLHASGEDEFEVADKLRRIIRFRRLNLNAQAWPMKEPFDAILCRNVLIYFDDETQSRLWPRFHALLKPGGILMLGHSERIHPLAGSGFEAADITTYRKTI